MKIYHNYNGTNMVPLGLIFDVEGKHQYQWNAWESTWPLPTHILSHCLYIWLQASNCAGNPIFLNTYLPFSSPCLSIWCTAVNQNKWALIEFIPRYLLLDSCIRAHIFINIIAGMNNFHWSGGIVQRAMCKEIIKILKVFGCPLRVRQAPLPEFSH